MVTQAMLLASAPHSSLGHAARVEWLGDRVWDGAEGLLDAKAYATVVAIVLGWLDMSWLHTPEQATQLKAMLATVRDPR